MLRLSVTFSVFEEEKILRKFSKNVILLSYLRTLLVHKQKDCEVYVEMNYSLGKKY